MTKPPCKFCGSCDTAKAGRNATGTQRYKCNHCDRRFTAAPKKDGRPPLDPEKGPMSRKEITARYRAKKKLQKA